MDRARSWTPLYSEELVGRREELVFLQDEYRAAREGRMRLVAIEGDAGIGKSRLIQELLRTSQPALLGMCSEQIRSPYFPLAPVLEALDRGRPWTPREEAKPEFFAAVADAVVRRTARSPLIIAIEDLQWADGATLELLGFLAQRISNVPALVLLTMRSPVTLGAEAGELTTFRSIVSRCKGASLHLRPLRRNDVRFLVRRMLQPRALQLGPETILQIEMLAEGNPLFAEELARIALENGELILQSRTPLSAAAILNERIAPFDEVERNALVHAAIIGESFDVPVLARILDAPLQDLVTLMQRCVERGLLLADVELPARFHFRHALIRKALADRLVLALAAPLHVRMAKMLEREEEDAARTAQLAYHWSAARVAPMARVWNERAAEQAWKMYAYRDAIRFYIEALRWEYPPGVARGSLYERLGTLYYIDGSGEEPALWFKRAMQEYEAAADAEGAARTIGLLADQHWVDARTDEALTAAERAADCARTLGDAAVYSDAVLSMARFSCTLGDPERAMVHLREAASAAPGADCTMQASMHEVLGETLAALGSAKRAFVELHAAAAVAARSESAELVAQIENNVALNACDLGELDLALGHHRRALSEAERTGLMWRVAYCSLGYARSLTLKGELHAAREQIWKALETGVATATFKTKAAAVGVPLGLMLNDRGLLDLCAREEALILARQSGEVQRIASVSAAFADLRAEQGAPEEAAALIRDALDRITRAHRSWDLLLCAASYASSDDVERARNVFSAALGRARVRRAYRLLFEALLGDRSGAKRERSAAVAADQFAAMGDRLHSARALELSGDSESALEAYTAMGSVRDCARLSKPATAAPLSPRQLEIAHLVAEGETNRTIANRLLISEHTVEHHVSAIFARLSLKSRAQLAGVMARREQQ